MATPAKSPQQPATAKPPAGFDLAKAKALAPKVNANLVASGISKYDRVLLKQFQIVAGIAADGLSGGGARGALIFYGIANPPAPFFKPTATAPYPWTPVIAKQLGVVPAAQAAAPAAAKPLASAPTQKAPVAASTVASGKPPAGFDLAKAKDLAAKVNANLISAGRDKYDHTLLRSFQIAAGIASDGLYGGGARGALIFYGQKNAPAPFFAPTSTAPYPWTKFIADSLAVKPPPVTSAKSSVAPATVITASTSKPSPIITVTGPRVVSVPQPRVDPIATQEQVEEYEPIAAATPSAAAPASASTSQAADSDSGANAAAPASASASGSGAGVLALLVVAAGGVYYATRKKRKASATYNY